MGRKNKKYARSLSQQANDRLVSMQAFGESKHEAMKDGTIKQKIFSFNTYKTYWKHIKYFLQYMKREHPEVTTLKKARSFSKEWLEKRANGELSKEPLSAWTIQTEAKALGKLFGIEPGDKDYFEPPVRHRKDIKRSRGEAIRDKHFSVANNYELVCFCKGTGLRRSELLALKKGDCITKNKIDAFIEDCRKNGKIEEKEGVLSVSPSVTNAGERAKIQVALDTQFFPTTTHFVFVRKGKGGRARLAPVIGTHKEQIVNRIMNNTSTNGKVWDHVSSNADIHGYRSEYASEIYKLQARDIKDIPYDKVNKGTGRRFQSDVYSFRGDEKGRKMDRRAMLYASKALGHNRVSVVGENYIRGI